MKSDPFEVLREFDLGDEKTGQLYSIPELAKRGFAGLPRLPVSLRIILEAILRTCDGKKVLKENIEELARWEPKASRIREIPFVVARIVLQDFTGVPLLVDLAAMRSSVARMGKDATLVEPLVPVDLVVDHSVQVDFSGTPEALMKNLELEFQRNRERYQFLKWGMQAFQTFKVVPPGIGIVHQVNLEHLAQGVLAKDGVYFPDSLVGTDSHTTMINGLGIVGWGVGGIEAEAGMLGQPVYFLTPDVVGVRLLGSLQEGVTATDLALTITQILRKAKVVGKFVEFYGEGASVLPVVDRATIANMAPEYGATIGFFPIDEKCLDYLRATGRSARHCTVFENYYRAQGLFGMPKKGDINYSEDIEIDLGTIVPSVAGPKRPQDRIELASLKKEFVAALSRPVAENGFGKSTEDLLKRIHVRNDIPTLAYADKSYGHRKARVSPSESEMRDLHPTPSVPNQTPSEVFPQIDTEIGHGSVLIAAITSCTNTSNPSVMLAAGLLAKKAVELGLKVNSSVKASLAPGSRVVTDYLVSTGLQAYLDALGFNLVGYGCTTCIGNSGPLPPSIEEAVTTHDLIAAAVLSGNRNFEARVHQSLKANFLMSPPLVVAFALAGRVAIDLTKEPLGRGKDGKEVFLKDIWPSLAEIREYLEAAVRPEVFQKLYRDFSAQNPKWNEISCAPGKVYKWETGSTYIQEPPFFENFSLSPERVKDIQDARALGIFGDSVTTDHISPAGSIKKTSPAGKYLEEQGVEFIDFNSYGSRRGNDRIMTRGTFANVRIKNLMVPGSEGGITKVQPGGETMSIFDAAMHYAREGIPLIVMAGQEYGTGSSRDWAAKGTKLLGIRAVVAQSFERIHRSNLVGMGILPLQFEENVSPATLKLDGTETFNVVGLNENLRPQQDLKLEVTGHDGTRRDVPVRCRIDTPIEIDYYRHGGILPYVLRQLLSQP